MARKAPVATYNAAAAKLVPKSVKAKSKSGLVEAFDATYPPDEFLASNHTTIIGFDADLGKALATTLGLTFDPKNVTFDNIIPRLQSGAVDIGVSGRKEIPPAPCAPWPAPSHGCRRHQGPEF